MTDENGNVKICSITGKVCYSKREAGEMLRKCKKKRTLGRKDFLPKRSYICEYCGFSHLTHLAERKFTKKFIKEREEHCKHLDWLRKVKGKRNRKNEKICRQEEF